jgi:hypothetical protein
VLANNDVDGVLLSLVFVVSVSLGPNSPPVIGVPVTGSVFVIV